MSSHNAAASTYDEILFPSQPLPQTHPDRLAAIGTLFGMAPQPIDHCRVLELGCGSGANLIPMAERHPDSEFVGIDNSQRQITGARQVVDVLRLKNINFRHLNIADADESLGQFDYIVCHGVFSWVSRDVQDRILAVCKSHLNPQGIAYISFNCYPGWHFRSAIRELMMGCTPDSAPPQQRVAQGRKVLEFMAGACSDHTPYSRLMKTDLDAVLHQQDTYLFHEFLEADNHPLYFHEFAELAADHAFQYLGDATFRLMFPANYGPTVEQNLLQFSPDVIGIEQNMDLLRNRGFRQTLLCHHDVSLVRHLNPGGFATLFFASEIRPQSAAPDLTSGQIEHFTTTQGVTISSPRPEVKAALIQLGRLWPHAISFDELVRATEALMNEQRAEPFPLSREQRDALKQNVLQCTAMGLVESRSGPDRFVSNVTEAPRASRFARLQAQFGPQVTNQRHELIVLDEVSQKILVFLDGELDQPVLLRVLIEAVDRGEISILINGFPASRGDSVAEILAETLTQTLAKLASNCLLVA